MSSGSSFDLLYLTISPSLKVMMNVALYLFFVVTILVLSCFSETCDAKMYRGGLRRKTTNVKSSKGAREGKKRHLWEDEDIRSRTVEYCPGGKAGGKGGTGKAGGKSGKAGRRLNMSKCECGKGGGPCWIYGDPYDDPVDPIPIDERATNPPVENVVPTPAAPAAPAPSPTSPSPPPVAPVPAPDTAPPASVPQGEEDEFESRTNESLDRDFEYEPYVESGSNDSEDSEGDRFEDMTGGPGIDIVVVPPMYNEGNAGGDESDNYVPSNDGN